MPCSQRQWEMSLNLMDAERALTIIMSVALVYLIDSLIVAFTSDDEEYEDDL